MKDKAKKTTKNFYMLYTIMENSTGGQGGFRESLKFQSGELLSSVSICGWSLETIGYLTAFQHYILRRPANMKTF